MTVEIIAEAAQGYEGDPTLAKLLARAAVRARADAVKFQLVYADELATPDYRYYALFRSLEMPRQAWEAAVAEARSGGIRVYFDVYGERSLREAMELGADGLKIHATDFFNSPLVRGALDVAPRAFVSLGGISVEELEAFIAGHRIEAGHDVCFMYGFQAEPTPIAANNLRRLRALKERFPGYRFGFMDHADGSTDDALTLALLALPLEVACIEKHITLDRAIELEDYVSALAPGDFQTFVRRIRHLEQALGTPDLRLTEAEQEYRRKAVKVVVANRLLRRGEDLSTEALALKRVERPGSSPFLRLEHVAGRRAAFDIQPNQGITEDMLA